MPEKSNLGLGIEQLKQSLLTFLIADATAAFVIPFSVVLPLSS